jgi:hypothetical protein
MHRPFEVAFIDLENDFFSIFELELQFLTVAPEAILCFTVELFNRFNIMGTMAICADHTEDFVTDHP